MESKQKADKVFDRRFAGGRAGERLNRNFGGAVRTVTGQSGVQRRINAHAYFE
jgi:hypothetical protein